MRKNTRVLTCLFRPTPFVHLISARNRPQPRVATIPVKHDHPDGKLLPMGFEAGVMSRLVTSLCPNPPVPHCNKCVKPRRFIFFILFCYVSNPLYVKPPFVCVSILHLVHNFRNECILPYLVFLPLSQKYIEKKNHGLLQILFSMCPPLLPYTTCDLKWLIFTCWSS